MTGRRLSPGWSALRLSSELSLEGREKLSYALFLSVFNGLAAKYFVDLVAIRSASLPRVFFLIRRLPFSVVRAMPA